MNDKWERGFQDGVRGFGILPSVLDADAELRSGYVAGQAALEARPELLSRLNDVHISRGLSGEPFDPESLGDEELAELAEEEAAIESIIAAIPRE